MKICRLAYTAPFAVYKKLIFAIMFHIIGDIVQSEFTSADYNIGEIIQQ